MSETRYITIPARTPSTRCRGCDEEIYFVTDARTRRPHPVSVQGRGCQAPVREQLEENPRTGVSHTVVAERDGRGISHFENCPAADRFRK